MLMAAMVASCESPAEPQLAFTSLEVEVWTADRDSLRYLLVAGDTGIVSIAAYLEDYCDHPGGQPRRCWVNVERDVVLRSSDENVVRFSQRSARTPAQVRIRGVAPGSAQLTIGATGVYEILQIDVAPVP